MECEIRFVLVPSNLGIFTPAKLMGGALVSPSAKARTPYDDRFWGNQFLGKDRNVSSARQVLLFENRISWNGAETPRTCGAPLNDYNFAFLVAASIIKPESTFCK